jgi:glycerophosphoryl diester phosphodiesterase
MKTKTILWAHRGAAAEEPENTLPSFARALALGADALETDLHMTEDGVIVASHDPDGARMCNVRREIRRTRFDDLRRWDAGWGFVDKSGARPFANRGYTIPTLEELLAAIGNVTLNVDVKQREPDMVAPLLALLKRLGAERRVLVASFSDATIRRVRRLGYAGKTGLARNEVAALLALPRAVLRFALGGDAAQLPTHVGPVRIARRSLIEKCHSLGLRVDFWTVNDPALADDLVALGADGVMTDDPRRVRVPKTQPT